MGLFCSNQNSLVASTRGTDQRGVTVLIDRHLTYAPAVTRTTILGLVSAPFPVYSFALTLHPLSSLSLDS